MTPSTHPNLMHRDAHRRDRVQEGVAIVLALLVLVATFAVATASVAGGMVPSASRTEGVGVVTSGDAPVRCEPSITVTLVADGSTASDRICSFGREPTAITG